MASIAVIKDNETLITRIIDGVVVEHRRELIKHYKKPISDKQKLI